jgi:hypothetical protein
MGSSVGTRMVTGYTLCVNGSDMVIALPFTPARVELINETTLYQVMWQKAMDPASGFETTNAGATTLVTSDLITPNFKYNTDDAAPPTARGFTLGQRANVNDTDNEPIHWVAYE